MQQAADFLEECDALAEVISAAGLEVMEEVTQFKGWTIGDVIRHLHYWNEGADIALNDPEAFMPRIAGLMQAIPSGGLRAYEDKEIPQVGAELFDMWQTTYRDMARRWGNIDPKTRVAWVGPSMSARSSMTARQMETWAHGHEVFDVLGKDRTETDRIRNIVILGVNTFGFCHKTHGLAVPDVMPHLLLTSPLGEIWEFGEGEDRIEGSAVGFCQAVTQTRHWSDTDLQITGPVAQTWMDHAQCFAGGPNPVPEPGSRHKKG